MAVCSATAVSRQTSGSATHSAFQPRPSRSCCCAIPSASTPACALTSLATVSRCSLDSGLRLCGMVMLPTAPAEAGQGSADEGEHLRELGDAIPGRQPGDDRIGQTELRAESCPDRQARSSWVQHQAADSPAKLAREPAGPAVPEPAEMAADLIGP